jgi:GNAT superfamily N-acetyltransferase
VAEIVGASALGDEVRSIQRRRSLDEANLRLSLEFAQRGTVWLARDAGEAIGIAIAHDSQGERFVGDCFVEPSYRGQGVGANLLEAAYEDTPGRGRGALVAPGDPAALALVLRFGLAPRETLLRFAGSIPREDELAKMAAGEYRFEVAAVDPAAQREALDELDRQTRGTAREADHALFAREANGTIFYLNGECVGYAYVWRNGRLGPLACASEAYLVQIFGYALATLRRTFGASWCTALVPGSNRRIGRAALRAGLRIQDWYLVAADRANANMSSYVAYRRLLL